MSYDVVDKKIVQRWMYDSSSASGISATGQGNHNLSVADVDADGKDEIIYGSCAFDDNGTVMYRTGLGHGDAMHVSDLNPDNPGLEVWSVHEETSATYGFEEHDAKTGAIIWGKYTGSDVGRGCAADLTSTYPGFEMWSGNTVYNCKGDSISNRKPAINFRIYWDGDLQDELLDGTKITKWSPSAITTLLSPSGVSSCNSTKATPNLSADILGDWREEVILWETSDSSKLRIYTTTTATTNRMFTLMHDPVYRLGVAWQNTAYNQPPHLGIYIGGGLTNISQPSISTIKYNSGTGLNSPVHSSVVYAANGTLFINSSEMIKSVSVYNVLGRIMLQQNKINNQEFSVQLPKGQNFYIVKVETTSGVQTQKILNK